VARRANSPFSLRACRTPHHRSPYAHSRRSCARISAAYIMAIKQSINLNAAHSIAYCHVRTRAQQSRVSCVVTYQRGGKSGGDVAASISVIRAWATEESDWASVISSKRRKHHRKWHIKRASNMAQHAARGTSNAISSITNIKLRVNASARMRAALSRRRASAADIWRSGSSKRAGKRNSAYQPATRRHNGAA